MAWFSRVGEFEGLDLVLEDVGEGDEAAFASVDGPDVLDGIARVGETEYGLEPVVLILFVIKIVEELDVGLLAEGEGGWGDVLGRVVVDGCRADVFVLSRQTDVRQ